MNALPTNKPAVPVRPCHGRLSLARILPALLIFLAGVALSALWFYRGLWHPAPPVVAAAVDPASTLSDATRAVLQHLDSPVEIRFYSSLNPSSVPDSVQAYSGRVDQLLAQYEQVAGDRLSVIRSVSSSNFNADAAQADGISAFNIDKGESCFLGIAVVCGSQKESLSRLDPEWEQALEPDLTRAIARAAEAKAAAQPAAKADTAALDAVKRAIPNLDAVSLDAGAKILRDASLAQVKQAAAEVDAQVKAAQQRFLEAQASQSEAAQQAARQQILKIQAEGRARLTEIALNSHAQIAALQQLKKAAP